MDDPDKRCMALVAELAEISRQRRGENWLHFTAVLSRMSSALGRLEAENGLSRDLETLRVLSMG
jgi:hypothetical protein